jgi:isopropylmalate/homocitrate/citramalate synthase
VEAGAEQVDVNVNGIGSHAGNIPLDEAVMTFKYLYGFDLPIKTEMFTEISRVVEEISGQKVHLTKPMVGRNVYAHHHAIDAIMKDPAVGEPFGPELVGNERRFPLVWDTQEPVLRYHLEKLNLDIGKVDMAKLVQQVRAKARRERRELEPVELIKMVDSDEGIPE